MGIEINEDHYIRLNTEQTFHQLEDELVTFSLEKEEYIGINAAGKFILELIKQKVKVSELLDALINQFDVDIDVCKTDTFQFLNELKNKNIVIISENYR